MEVYRRAHDKYIGPVSTTGADATKCGWICRGEPGLAKGWLTVYLDKLQFIGIEEYKKWYPDQQKAISAESRTWSKVNGLRHKIGKIEPVGFPPPPPPTPCPEK